MSGAESTKKRKQSMSNASEGSKKLPTAAQDRLAAARAELQRAEKEAASAATQNMEQRFSDLRTARPSHLSRVASAFQSFIVDEQLTHNPQLDSPLHSPLDNGRSGEAFTLTLLDREGRTHTYYMHASNMVGSSYLALTSCDEAGVKYTQKVAGTRRGMKRAETHLPIRSAGGQVHCATADKDKQYYHPSMLPLPAELRAEIEAAHTDSPLRDEKNMTAAEAAEAWRHSFSIDGRALWCALQIVMYERAYELLQLKGFAFFAAAVAGGDETYGYANEEMYKGAKQLTACVTEVLESIENPKKRERY